MYQLLLRMAVPQDKRDETFAVLQGLIGPTEATKGCRGCRVFRDADAVAYLVTWDERADMEAHFRSERFRQLLPYIELSIEPPLAEVSSLTPVGGMEWIVSAINSQPE
ncbi:MAG: antibiotic biosynthesis monooxygenase [Pirellulaceae bacterium]